MESSGDLRPSSFHPSSYPTDEAHFSIETITSARNVAQRARRRSLFIPERKHNDIGTSVLSHADFPRPRAKSLTFLNTQRAPDFDKETAHKIMEEIMSQELAHKTYDAKECSSLSQRIVDEIQSRVTSVFNLTGFKLLCVCYITKRAPKIMHMESGCAWDETRHSIQKDSFVDCAFKNTDIVAVSSVYCVHCKQATNPPTEAALPVKPRPCTRISSGRSPQRQGSEEKPVESDVPLARRRASTNEY